MAGWPHGNRTTNGLALLDVDGDQDLDLIQVCGNAVGTRPAHVEDHLLMNDGQGRFFDSSQRYQPSDRGAIALGDMNGDGVYWRQPSGSYTHTSDATVFFVSSAALARDLDGDGLLDLIFVEPGGSFGCQGHALFWNQGGSQFATASGFGRTNGALSSIAAGDIDEDGDSGLVVGFLDKICSFSSTVRAENGVYRNLGGRVFEDIYRSAGPRQYPMSLDRTRQVFLIDFDGDGDLDFYAHNDSVDQAPRSKIFVNVHRHLLAPYHSSVGRDFELELHGGTKGGSIFVAFGEASVPIAGLGRFGLDPNTIIHVASLGAPTTGRVAKWQMRIPAIPAAIGTKLFWQGLVIDRQASLTNVLEAVLHGW